MQKYVIKRRGRRPVFTIGRVLCVIFNKRDRADRVTMTININDLRLYVAIYAYHLLISREREQHTAGSSYSVGGDGSDERLAPFLTIPRPDNSIVVIEKIRVLYAAPTTYEM